MATQTSTSFASIVEASRPYTTKTFRVPPPPKLTLLEAIVYCLIELSKSLLKAIRHTLKVTWDLATEYPWTATLLLLASLLWIAVYGGPYLHAKEHRQMQSLILKDTPDPDLISEAAATWFLKGVIQGRIDAGYGLNGRELGCLEETMKIPHSRAILVKKYFEVLKAWDEEDVRAQEQDRMPKTHNRSLQAIQKLG